MDGSAVDRLGSLADAIRMAPVAVAPVANEKTPSASAPPVMLVKNRRRFILVLLVALMLLLMRAARRDSLSA